MRVTFGASTDVSDRPARDLGFSRTIGERRTIAGAAFAQGIGVAGAAAGNDPSIGIQRVAGATKKILVREVRVFVSAVATVEIYLDDPIPAGGTVNNPTASRNRLASSSTAPDGRIRTYTTLAAGVTIIEDIPSLPANTEYRYRVQWAIDNDTTLLYFRAIDLGTGVIRGNFEWDEE